MAEPADDTGPGAAWITWVLGLALLAAVVLRCVYAASKGLVLDEFHTWFHATQETLPGLLDSLLADNHPPLSFLLVRWARALLGDEAWMLRAPSLLCGALELAVVAIVARRWFGATEALVAVAFLGVSTLHFDLSSQARMYALLSLVTTLVMVASIHFVTAGCSDERRKTAWCALPLVLLGLHTHYFFLHDLLVLAVGTVLAYTLRARSDDTAAPLASALRDALPALLVAVLLAAPWYATGFRAQLAHGLPPGGDDHSLGALAEAWLHLFFVNIRLAGELGRGVFLAAGGLLLMLAVYGFVRLTRRAGVGGPARGWILGAVAFGVPLEAWLVAQVLPRSGFTWMYLLPSASAAALLIAAAWHVSSAWIVRLPAVAALAAGASLVGLHLSSSGSEDYPGAVARVLDLHRDGTAVVVVEYQPAVFPNGQPWGYYAPRLAGQAPPPVALPMRGYHLARPRDVERFERFLVLRSALPDDARLLRELRARFGEPVVENFGYGLDVFLFE